MMDGCYNSKFKSKMKHMQENGKFLEKYIQKVHEELKMRIKFCKQRVNEADLVLMLL